MHHKVLVPKVAVPIVWLAKHYTTDLPRRACRYYTRYRLRNSSGSVLMCLYTASRCLACTLRRLAHRVLCEKCAVKGWNVLFTWLQRLSKT